MITDPIEIEESLVAVVDYGWEDEMTDFEATFDIEVNLKSSDDIDTLIQKCKEEGLTTHIFYHLLILKSAYPEVFQVE